MRCAKGVRGCRGRGVSLLGKLQGSQRCSSHSQNAGTSQIYWPDDIDRPVTDEIVMMRGYCLSK